MADFGISATALGWIAAATAAASAVATGVTQVQSSKANAAAADQEAKDIDEQRKIEQQQERFHTKQILSKQTSIAAASGVDTTSGTPLNTALDTAFEGEMNALKIGYGYDRQKLSRKYEAGMYRAQAGNEAIGTGLRTGSSLLSSWAQTNGDNPYNRWGNYSRNKP